MQHPSVEIKAPPRVFKVGVTISEAAWIWLKTEQRSTGKTLGGIFESLILAEVQRRGQKL